MPSARRGLRVSKRSIEVEGLHHGGAPIPLAARVGGLVMSSGIMGMDPATGELVGTVEGQVVQLFSNIERVLAAAGGSASDVVKITFFVTDRSSREAINERWNALFPDPGDRPARHTLTYDLPSPMLVQAELVALLGES
jgi:2-iminobutanoate/2-iminopropanoate deaminase